jgi:DNA-binding MarR family transcriptional regulator
MNSAKRKVATDILPEDCLAEIFILRRDLLGVLDQHVIQDAPVSIDEADLLVYLLGAREYAWPDVPFDKDGYVPTNDLRRVLVHDRGLFSRRIQKLMDAGLITSKEPTTPGRDRRYVIAVRITDSGVKIMKPIWQRYCLLAQKLFGGLSKADISAHCRVMAHIGTIARSLTAGGTDY